MTKRINTTLTDAQWYEVVLACDYYDTVLDDLVGQVPNIARRRKSLYLAFEKLAGAS